jgi:DNA-binding transcriptional LysR family regulator
MEYSRLPEIHHLATLAAVVERGGVDEAARLLNIGQPAVTKRLRALDSHYATPLMVLKGRRLTLTPAGERVYAFARMMLESHQGLCEQLRAIGSGHHRLRLEVTSAIGEHLLPELLLRFHELYPQSQIESRMGYSRQIQTHLATGVTDLALLELPPDHPDILVQRWLEDEIILVCAKHHPLVTTPLITVAELPKLNYVLREPQAAMRPILDKALADIGIKHLPAAMEVGSTDTIIEMLGHGRYVSFLPRFAVADALVSGSLFHVKVQGVRIKRTLWIARTRANLDHPLADAFIRLLRDG